MIGYTKLVLTIGLTNELMQLATNFNNADAMLGEATDDDIQIARREIVNEILEILADKLSEIGVDLA